MVLYLFVMVIVVCAHDDIVLTDGWTIRPISDPTPTAKSVAVMLPHTWNATYTKGTHYNR